MTARLMIEPQERARFEIEAQLSGIDGVLNWNGDEDMKPLAGFDLIVVSKNGMRDLEANQSSLQSNLQSNLEGIRHSMLQAHLRGVPILEFERFLQEIKIKVDLEKTGWSHYLIAATRQTALLRGYRTLKHLLEPLLALVLLVFLLPIFLITALLIQLLDPGTIFYSQVRTGYLGKPFRVHKFRTMRHNAEQNGPQWARSEDQRITPLGKWLRLTHLDELPQLWNVIKGEMSFVGPRPERPEFYEALSQEIPLFILRTWIRPGITGWAQVCAGYAASIEESRTKLEFDLYYIQHHSPLLDLIILIKTIKVSLPLEPKSKNA